MSRHTLLIVDDEVNVLKSLKRLLIDTDYKILIAESGEEGLKKFDDNSIDVVISDYRMPGMNGVEFLSEVKKISPNTMRLILSGYADAVAIVEAINEGQVYRFITKPWNDHELLTTITTSVEQHGLQVENTRLYEEIQSQNEELQNLTKSLEEKVSERTRDLEIKNRALVLARNILNYLPLGIIGIDSEYVIVYMNENLPTYFDSLDLGVGLNAKEIIQGEEIQAIEQVLGDQKPRVVKCSKSSPICSLWCSLPGGAGVIGVYSYSNIEDYTKLAEVKLMEIGASNGR